MRNTTRLGAYLVIVSGFVLVGMVTTAFRGWEWTLFALAVVVLLAGLTCFHAGLTADLRDASTTRADER